MVGIATHLVKIYEKSITPFEKLDGDFELCDQKLSAETYSAYLQSWENTISPHSDIDRISYYFTSLALDEEKKRKLLSPVKLRPDSVVPEWVHVLNRAILQLKHLEYTNCSSEPIPFIHVFWPFIEDFRIQLSKKLSAPVQALIHDDLLQQLQLILAHRLSSLAQIVLQKEFEQFAQEQCLMEASEIEENKHYQSFVAINWQDGFEKLWSCYPMLARLTGTTVSTFTDFMIKILNRFNEDKDEIFYRLLPAHPGKIINIEADIADQHHGESTLIIGFESGRKIVYKPGSMGISHAYHQLIDWVNDQLQTKLKTFNVIDKTTYGWLEFVENQECKSETAVMTYYRNAGYLLGITYFLNSSDYHYENVIAAAACPVLIDHETLLQPTTKSEYSRFSTEERKLYENSVLKTSLLPAVIPNIGLLYGYMAGFGSSKYEFSSAWTKAIVNCNTDKSKRVIQPLTLIQEKANKPVLAGRKKNLAAYQAVFIEGFTKLYLLFESKLDFLLGPDSPLEAFQHQEIRYVWRATNIYATIRQHLLDPAFLSDANKYGLKLELLARAYLTSPSNAQLMALLQAERLQLLNGNVPVFKLNTSSNYLELQDGTRLPIFEVDALNSLKRKIKAISDEDFLFQLGLIRKYVAC